MDDWSIGVVDEAKEYESRYKKHIVCTKYRVEGLTIEQFRTFGEEPLRNQEKMNNRIENWLLEQEDEGINTIMIKCSTPPLISNRAIVSTLYQYMKEDGTFCAIQSSRGNEKIVEKYKDQIGKDVLANQNVCMTKLIPFDGGCEVN